VVEERRTVYMDHAATTPLHPEALEAMLPYLGQSFGNPSGVYRLARDAHEAVDEARASVAGVLGCHSGEVIFTSCGTESDNAALKGAAFALRERGNHIITSAIEHHAVLHTCDWLEAFGFEVTYLPVDRFGLVSVDDLGKAITGRTILVSIMLANNEIGTIQPVAELARLVKARGGERRIVFHTDAVQGARVLGDGVDSLGVDMLSLSAHKIQGPKGVGVLYVREGTPFLPEQVGGGQEGNRRAGTENVAGIVGTSVALRIAAENRESNRRECQVLRDRLVEGILSGIPDTHLNGHATIRLPNNANIAFDYIEGEAILLNLDLAGIAASSGSACATGDEEPSHVLTAIGLEPTRAHGSIRFTVGPTNSLEDVDYVLSVLPGIVEKLRFMSPLAARKGRDRGSDVQRPGHGPLQ
jgi:cysteine desulfurase